MVGVLAPGAGLAMTGVVVVAVWVSVGVVEVVEVVGVVAVVVVVVVVGVVLMIVVVVVLVTVVVGLALLFPVDDAPKKVVG